ncbi:glutamate-rich protein 2 isoform X2 [Anguilla anguilla]|uniref:glutamate-rich protein 2 isoform X2 n=1 Tax=Anguilla anguilla TaxID=7936 RepID=UPI0015AC2AC9|nr:glutamate-rich protein 2 isoform X2 [Anguilla anguilla]
MRAVGDRPIGYCRHRLDMNRLECVVESPKNLSNKAIGHQAVRRPDGVMVESLDVQPRKDSTVPVKEMEKELGKLEVVSIDGILPVETNESTSLSTYSRYKPKSAGGRSPAKSSALKACTRRKELGCCRPDDSTGPTDRTREYAGSTFSGCKALRTDINIKGKQSPDTTDGTGEQACAQDQPGSLQSADNLCMTSQDDSKPEEEGEISEDEEHRAPIELFAEFLKSVMDKDYILAKKLCQMILIYEPDNPEAKQFIPLIEEKLLLGQEDDESSNDTEDSSDSSDSEGESTSSSDSSSSSEQEGKKKKHKLCPPPPVSN